MKNMRLILGLVIAVIVVAVAGAVFVLPRLIGEPVITINQPATDGMVIENISDTLFEATAWDTRYGTDNGDGIQEVHLELYALPEDPRQNEEAEPVFVQVEVLEAYCLFGGVTCTPMGEAEGSILLPDGDYVLRARAVSQRGDQTTDWVYREFTLATGTTE
jgi:hypothetical protein